MARIKKSGFDKKTGEYFDETAEEFYEKKPICEICGKAWVDTTVHHYLPQGKSGRDKRSKDPKPCHWTPEFIKENQKLFTLCLECHHKVHHWSPDKIVNGHRLGDFIWREEKTKIPPPQKVIIIKKGKVRWSDLFSD